MDSFLTNQQRIVVAVQLELCLDIKERIPHNTDHNQQTGRGDQQQSPLVA